MSINQHLTATLTATGPQEYEISTNGTGGDGAYIAVRIATVLIYVHDLRAATTYIRAVLDSNGGAMFLPEARNITVQERSGSYPGLVINARGVDRVSEHYYQRDHELRIRIGYVNWLILDRQAFDSMVQAWTKVAALAAIVLPKA